LEAQLNVQLITHTSDPERVVSSAARLCYSSADIQSIMDHLTVEKINEFVNKLANMGHESPFEHVTFTFGIEGVSRSLLAQITRHRIASYSVKSQRYVREGQFAYVIPDEIKKYPGAKNLYIMAMEQAQEDYNSITDALLFEYFLEYIKTYEPEIYALYETKRDTFDFSCSDFYDEHINKVPNKVYNAMEKKAIENARYVLPNACETKIVMTMNARSLLNFFSLRGCERAQDEIRNLATEMLRIVKPIAPNIFKVAGPSCVKKFCSEGPMSCGRPKEIKQFFLTL